MKKANTSLTRPETSPGAGLGTIGISMPTTTMKSSNSPVRYATPSREGRTAHNKESPLPFHATASKQQFSSKFAESVKDSLRVQLSQKEIQALHDKYRVEASDTFDCSKFLRESKARSFDMAKLSCSSPPRSPVLIDTSTAWSSLRQIPTSILMGTNNLQQSQEFSSASPSSSSSTSKSYSFNEIIALLSQKLNKLFPNMKSRKELLQRCIIQTDAERGRPMILTAHDIKHVLQYKFHLPLSSKSIDNIFAELDPNLTGQIRMRVLFNRAISHLLQESIDFGETLQDSLIAIEKSKELMNSTGSVVPATAATASAASTAVPAVNASNASNATNASVSTTNQQPQSATLTSTEERFGVANTSSATAMSTTTTRALEEMIYQKIKSKAVGRNFHQTVLFCFGDSRNKVQNSGISMEQLLYTVKYKFKLPVSNYDIANLFAKHSVQSQAAALAAATIGSTGIDTENEKAIAESYYIPTSTFVQYLTSTFDRSVPLIENESYRISEILSGVVVDANSQLPEILQLIRTKLVELSNKHSKSPIYLLQTHHNLTKKQLKHFLENKLKIRTVNEDMLNEICKYYNAKHNSHLIDVKRLLSDSLGKTLERNEINKWRVQAQVLVSDDEVATVAVNHPSNISPDLYIFGNLNNRSTAAAAVINSAVKEGSQSNENMSDPTAADDDVVGQFSSRSNDTANLAIDRRIIDQIKSANAKISTDKNAYFTYVQLNERPKSLTKHINMSKADISQLLYTKLVGKCGSATPLTTLHTLFDVNSSKYSTKSQLRAVFTKLDIILTDEEFDEFFVGYDLNDGTERYDIRQLLVTLFPDDFERNIESNSTSVIRLTATTAVNNRQEDMLADTRREIAKDEQEILQLTKQLLSKALVGKKKHSGTGAGAGAGADAVGNCSDTRRLHAQDQQSGVVMAWMFAGQPGADPNQWAQSINSPHRKDKQSNHVTWRPHSSPMSAGANNNNNSNNATELCVIGSRPLSAAAAMPTTNHDNNSDHSTSPVIPETSAVRSPSKLVISTPPASASRSSKGRSPLVANRLKSA